MLLVSVAGGQRWGSTSIGFAGCCTTPPGPDAHQGRIPRRKLRRRAGHGSDSVGWCPASGSEEILSTSSLWFGFGLLGRVTGSFQSHISFSPLHLHRLCPTMEVNQKRYAIDYWVDIARICWAAVRRGGATCCRSSCCCGCLLRTCAAAWLLLVEGPGETGAALWVAFDADLTRLGQLRPRVRANASVAAPHTNCCASAVACGHLRFGSASWAAHVWGRSAHASGRETHMHRASCLWWPRRRPA